MKHFVILCIIFAVRNQSNLITAKRHFHTNIIMHTLKHTLYFVLPILFFAACHSADKETYSLEISNDSICFKLNSHTSMYIKALFPYTDGKGKEYLTFQNEVEPEILVYDMDTQDYIRTISLEKEGPDGIGIFCGYYIASWNEIYIPCMMKNEIDIVNSEGTIQRKIPYSQTVQGKQTLPFILPSFPYQPLHILDRNIYIPQCPNPRLGNRTMEDSPVTLVLDTVTRKLTEFPLRFPRIMTSKRIQGNTLGIELSYSQCFNGNHFLYSFFFDENILVVSPTGETKHRIQAKSRYIDKFYNTDNKAPDLASLAKTLCEVPFYGNLIYDKYREIYYRFVYPETELSPNDNYMDIWQLGRSRFAIMILDKNLNVLGETLFPDNTFASNLFFIRRDGLYISTSFSKNPNYSDDELCFKKIEFVKH